MVMVMQSVEELVLGLFGAVTEVLARATAALLEADVLVGQAVIDADPEIDEQIEAVKRLVWDKIDSERPTGPELRYLVSMSRGIVQRMSEVAIEMWRSVTEAYAALALDDLELHEADVELDILHDRLTAEVATGVMRAPVVAQVALLARFYERIGDHAVNLSRRIATSQD